MTKKKSAATMPNENLSDQITRMKNAGYRVFPGTYFVPDGNGGIDQMRDVMNFAHALGVHSTSHIGAGSTVDNYEKHGGLAPNFGGFTSCGTEVPEKSCGTPGRGYINWGSNNRLPNMVVLANSMLTYTATALKFNVDVACGLGMVPVYRYYSEAGGATKEVEIPFAAAGEMLRSRIRDLRVKMFNLTKDYINQAPRGEALVEESVPEENGIVVVTDKTVLEAEPAEETTSKEAPVRHERDADGTYFKRIADDLLEDMLDEYTKEIETLKEDLAQWEKTNEDLQSFLSRTKINKLNQLFFTDLLQLGIFFPEILLTQEGKTKYNRQWKPKIIGLNYRPAMSCRLERMDEKGVSRFVYISNKWINPADGAVDKKIAALPAIDPLHPLTDLEHTVRQFRLRSGEEDKNVWARPTRHILPISYPTEGRVYYPQPAYWAIFNDIYQFAANIIRDRAIRKANENMFGRIVYVHSEYLERLVTQINAKKTEEEKQKIKEAEINKIKEFLTNKFNNGQTFAACTFRGSDGKDHDAFKVETIPYNTKNAAEADKTEIADASGIIMFALECHPDLIGSTPGGSSSKGGTYQREMLQIKQAKMAPTQQLVIDFYNFIGHFNKWDKHLGWKISQRTLTTLDRNHSGQEDD